MFRLLLLLFPFFTLGASFPEKIHVQQMNKIGYISISDERPIETSTYLKVKFALEEYEKLGVSFVYLHLDTYGGEVNAAIKIATLLREFDARTNIPVVTLIGTKAISAGALIAYACRYIGVIEGVSTMGAATVVTMGEGKMEVAPEKMQSFLRSQFSTMAMAYGRDPLIAEEMVTPNASGRLLTLKAVEMMNLHVADFEVARGAFRGEDPEILFTLPFFQDMQNREVIKYSNWKVNFFAFLSHPIVAALLLLGLIVGGYAEFTMPGVFVPGAIAVMSLMLIILSSFAVAASNFLELILFGIGVVLLAIELFIIPGFGITGILGFVFLFFAIIMLLLPGMSQIFTGQAIFEHDFMMKLTLIFAAILLSILLIMMLARYMVKHPKLWGKLVLEKKQDEVQESQIGVKIGDIGETVSSLSCSGHAKINGELFPVMAKGEYIEEGKPIVVTAIHGSTIYVEER